MQIEKFELNPYSPTDAKHDSDNDGLTNLQEYQNDTNPTDEDSDDDGLNDGEEIKKYHTDATKADTDGDGYSDYEEVSEKTDPLDADDYPDKPDDGVCFTPGFSSAIVMSALIITIIVLLISTRYQRKNRR